MNAGIELMNAVLNDYVGVLNVSVKIHLSKGLRTSTWDVKTMRQTTLDEFGMEGEGFEKVKHPKQVNYHLHPSLLTVENIVDTYKELKEDLDKKIFSMR